MKFAQNGYYIEEYVKCTNCGVLIYETGTAAHYLEGDKQSPYCTKWCIEWATQKKNGVENPTVSSSFDK